MRLYPHSLLEAAALIGGLAIAYVGVVTGAAYALVLASEIESRRYARNPNLPHTHLCLPGANCCTPIEEDE